MMSRFDTAEVRAYWRTLYSDALGTESAAGDDLLDVVCHPGSPRWFNRYFAYCQEKAFERGLAGCGAMSGVAVLDIGCGTGRWSVRLRDRGAQVLAIDLSEEVIATNMRRLGGVEFRCADFLSLELPRDSIDVAVSVTVLQHLPFSEQEAAIKKAAEFVRPGGHLLLLENIHDQDRHVFSRSKEEWSLLLKWHGFRPIYIDGYGYDVLLRGWRTILRAMGRASIVNGSSTPPDAQAEGKGRDHLARRLYYELVYRPLIALSYPMEEFCVQILPDAWATHCVFLSRREQFL